MADVTCRGCRVHLDDKTKRFTVMNGVGQRLGTGRVDGKSAVYDPGSHPSAPHPRALETAFGIREPKKEAPKPKAKSVSTHRPDPSARDVAPPPSFAGFDGRDED